MSIQYDRDVEDRKRQSRLATNERMLREVFGDSYEAQILKSRLERQIDQDRRQTATKDEPSPTGAA